ncbi:MAG TPA: HEPN domain-containing protein [Candidatus Altiarchaeales archaeon]|nr:HEPN domain-containing protein [Candidatus Altiarchaeales archaeon]HEX54961.1 HEPN domain-containing protein [Candidatus Altiarchaeales archaeon]
MDLTPYFIFQNTIRFMAMDDVEFFIDKAKRFFETALYNYKREEYDIALFNIEQACQLLVKAKLLEVSGEFPKTHNLIFLLRELGKYHKKKEIERFLKENITGLSRLVDIYITSRYMVREFYKEDVDLAINLFKKLEKSLR